MIQKTNTNGGWRTDEPPKDSEIELLCVLFDEDDYRELKPNSWDKNSYNRTILEGRWNGHTFEAYYNYSNGDPYYQVVAWKKIDYGEKFYHHCIGEVVPR